MGSSNQKWDRNYFQGKSRENYETSYLSIVGCLIAAFIIGLVVIFSKLFF